VSLSPDRLRASDLNELLQPDFLEAKRLAVSPMQAFGAMFKDATVLNGMVELSKESWAMVAREHDLPPPEDDDVQRAMDMMPERAIQQAFMWTDDWGETRKWGSEQREAYAKILPEFNFNATPGAVDWLTALNQWEVPCVVCSDRLAREQVNVMLEKAGLGKFFQQIVTAEDGCETTEQSYLLASLKINRPPMKCVVFEDEPRGVSAAHDATAKVIAVVGDTRPGQDGLRRDFTHADLRVGGLDELTISQLKEVAEREAEPLW
jgi:beta-phosphoglucomutase-like phosphatase (HAD superfamily)